MTIEFPEKGFADEIDRYRKRKPTVTMIIERDVVAPVMFRNTNSDRAETKEFDGVLHAQVNGEKFVTKERLRGLDLLRRLDEEFGDGEWQEAFENGNMPDGLISNDYTHNEPERISSSLNLETLTYGVAVTGNQQKYDGKSHVYEGYTYSLHPYDIMRKETRNAVYESGTMRDEEGKQSSSLFEEARVHPDNKFIHFVSVEAGTPGMFLYVLHNILNTSKYGARETRAGKTIDNKILGFILGKHDTALSTAEFMEEFYEDESLYESLSEYVNSESRVDWEVYSEHMSESEGYPDWLEQSVEVAGRRRSDADEILYEHFREDTENALSNIIEDIE
jgi:CRISPR-associated protein Csc2